MSQIVIKIEHLFKEYRLGVIGHGTLYRDLQSWWAKVRRKEDPNSIINLRGAGEEKDNILALNDINLEIYEGEVLGIIGANGAGKSTMLKILSRVTAPTKGIVKVRGRIASLLEVGTGFHPELTGRENIYLNGAINGMDRKEVRLKLDEIVAFAGVEKFLDTPVKRFSSGMHVRLGFAVAAHLDPEILVVDEVLAVGDAEFQRKAIGKMQDVSESNGRTVLIVSHNMDTIKRLCTRSLLLNSGTVIAASKTEEIIEKYIGQESNNLNSEKVWDSQSQTNKPKGVLPGDELIKPIRLRTIDSNGNTCGTFNESEDIYIELQCDIIRRAKVMRISFVITNHKNIDVLIMRDNSRDNQQEAAEPGRYLFKTKIQGNLLNEGFYTISFGVNEGRRAIHIRESNIISFSVMDTYSPEGARGLFSHKWPDVVVRPKIDWVNEKI